MEIKPTELFCLLKFGRKDRLEDLRRTGNLYMSSINTFKQKEEPDGRNDEFEGAFEIQQVAPGSVISYEHPSGIRGSFISEGGVMQNYVLGNLACFYAVSEQHFSEEGMWKPDVDERMSLLGDHVLFVHNKTALIKRIEQAVQREGMAITHEFLRYDYEVETYNGKLSLLQKRRKYSYQKEYRFFLNTGRDNIFILNIGSLADISDVMPFSTFKEHTFAISKRIVHFNVSPEQKESKVFEFKPAEKRVQLHGNFSKCKGLVLHLGTSTGHSKPIPIFGFNVLINEDICWCKNMWLEWEDVPHKGIIDASIS
ncbi:MAG: hypothetical protein PSX36_11890 [bacterium]|nr:hypothetical protein [bacterium]